MKSNSIPLACLALVAPLVFLSPSIVLAGGGAESNAPPAQTGGNRGPFMFRGGNPMAFLQAVDKHYSVDWWSVADLEPGMPSVQIPPLRLNEESLQRILKRPLVADHPQVELEALIALYNSLQQAKPELGQLVVEGSLEHPAIVLFYSHFSASTNALRIKTKAFPLKGMPEKEWEKLLNVIQRILDELAVRYADRVPSLQERGVTLHADTGLLIATGSDSVIETVESLVSAWQANLERGEAKPVPAK